MNERGSGRQQRPANQPGRPPPGRPSPVGQRRAQALGRPARERDAEPTAFYAECIVGLESFAAAELTSVPGLTVSSSRILASTKGGSARPASGDQGGSHPAPPDGGEARHAAPSAGYARELPFRFAGPWRRLLSLRTITGVYAVVAMGAPRPAALLDDGTFKRLMALVGHLRSMHPGGAFRTLRLSAAGADSPAFRRLRDRVGSESGLIDVDEGGDLLLRVRRAPGGADFELTVRISPRPLAARGWRRCNLPGALNGTVAAVMADLTGRRSEDVFLNLACGSGTLLIERALAGPVGRLVGCDVDAGALACAAENVLAAGRPDVELHAWDATALPLPDSSIDALAVDLPFGQLVGSHATNEQLYPRLLAEAGRVARPGARLVAITQQLRLFERSAHELRDTWTVERTIRLTLPTNAAPISPGIFVLRRA